MPEQLPKRKYHVALSFAGEDRSYVERVAQHLVSEGVDVFYDKFEQGRLWGKNLYTHLRDVYEQQAQFTVMFISKDYKEKAWTNLERESAQARDFNSHREYILPAFFDTSIEVPGLLKTVGYITLADKQPEDVGTLIVNKLRDLGIELSSEQFTYSEEAMADVDFPFAAGTSVGDILRALKSYVWYTQSPAIDAVSKLDWNALDKNEVFVIGRNIYQAACGSENKALNFLSTLRSRLAGLPRDTAFHLLNGMFYEVYFDKEGHFRRGNVKGKCLQYLLSVQSVGKYKKSILFIRRALQSFKKYLPFLPSTVPELVQFQIKTQSNDPTTIVSIKLKEQELLAKSRPDSFSKTWELSHKSFTREELKATLVEAWSIPAEQLEFKWLEQNASRPGYTLLPGYTLKEPENWH